MANEMVVRFCIWNFEDISPDDITKSLGIEPIKTYTKGKTKNKIGYALSDNNGWILDSGIDKYAPFDHHLNGIFKIINSKIDIFKIMCNKYYCEISCAIYIDISDGYSVPCIHIEKKYINDMHAMSLEIDFDIIFTET